MPVHAAKVEPGSSDVRQRSVAGRLVCAVVAIALLQACSWLPFRQGGKEGRVNDCNKPQVYEQAGSNPPLRIPVGLDALNTRGALRIPELREPEAPRKLTDACLDEPPKFAANARLMPAPRDKKTEKKLREEQKALDKEAKAQEKRKRAEEKAAAKAPPAAAPASPPATP